MCTNPPVSRGREKVALIHPDLGIGGAERLVVDAALELSALGYEVRAAALPLRFSLHI